jgi:hypothetical protein
MKFPFVAATTGWSIVPLAQSYSSVPPVANTMSPTWSPPHSLGATGPARSAAHGPAALSKIPATTNKKIPFGLAKWDLEAVMDRLYQR